MSERIITAEERNEDKEFEWSLRPKRLAEFIGQEGVKANLEILISAARGRNEPIEHILIAGPPGLGKTTLANIMANEMGVNIRTTSGPAIEHQGALASILTNLEDRDIFFVDEIHRLARPVEESLYPAMEDFKFDFVSGKGAGAQTFRLQLPRFTVIGATTRQGMLSAPLRDRFGAVYPLYFYGAEELFAIVIRSARLLKVSIDDAGAHIIASRARGTPRVANRLLRRVRDFAQVRAQGSIDEK
ncbi:MAG TPA: Holliday junction branch migration DNA helicase RuvB, partial [Candidatus Dormibacteraeota bacterium]|nr:Holliday junction branch migration DNA helicase RuvB [Candidatus Dormibacteraeota bacterium]